MGCFFVFSTLFSYNNTTKTILWNSPHFILWNSLLMTKKDYILKVLEALINIWPLARGLKILVEGNALDDVAIDNIVDILSKTIDTIQDDEAKTKLQNSKDFLQKLKTIEEESHLRDESSIQLLDDMIKEI